MLGSKSAIFLNISIMGKEVYKFYQCSANSFEITQHDNTITLQYGTEQFSISKNIIDYFDLKIGVNKSVYSQESSALINLSTTTEQHTFVFNFTDRLKVLEFFETILQIINQT
jgi:hypothetical protein